MRQVINVRKEIKIEEVPAPLCGDKEVLVANVYSLISTGTERQSVKTRSKNIISLSKEIKAKKPELFRKVKALMRAQGILYTYKMVKEKLNEPHVLGYSSAGIVIDVGKDVKTIKVGDRVACGGGGYAVHADVIRVPENLCVKVPDSVELSEAAYTTVGAIALQGVRRADVKIGERVGVIGLGLIGLLTVQILKAAGVRVIGFDISSPKVSIAKKLGADEAYVVDEVNISSVVDNFTSGVGLDSVIITASTESNKPVEQALQMIRKRGKIVVVGDVSMRIPRDPFYEKEGDFLISTSYGPGRYDKNYEEKGIDYPIAYVRWTERRNMEAFLDLLSSKKIDTGVLTTHIYPIEKAKEAYEMVMQGRGIGILIEYGKELNRNKVNRIVSVNATKGRENVAVGVIGAGSFAKKYHLPNLKKIDGFNIYAIATATGVNAVHVAKKYGAKYATTDYKKLLQDKNIDAVIVSTRHNLHAKIAMEALKAGKHVFLEKPAAMNEKELENLLRVARESGKVLMVGFNRRYAPFTIKAKELLQKTAGPVIVNYRVNAGKLPKDHWIYDPEEGGGRIIGECVHFFDYINYIVGSTPQTISVMSVESNNENIKSEDNFSVQIKYRNGSMGVLTYSSIGSPAYSKETIYIERDGLSIKIDDFKEMSVYTNKIRKMKLKKQDKGHYRELLVFLKNIREGKIMNLEHIKEAHLLAYKTAELIKFKG